MNKQEIIDRVEHIRSLMKDPEAAHAEEDELYHEFVKWLTAHGSRNVRKLAKELHKVRNVKFPRWAA